DHFGRPSGDSRVDAVQTIHDAQDDQERGLKKVRDHGREAVVVAELDLVDTNRVILIDDGNSVPLEERGQGVAHVEVTGPAVEVGVGQEKLTSVPAVPAETFVVDAHQERLADGRRSLDLPKVVGSPTESKLAD